MPLSSFLGCFRLECAAQRIIFRQGYLITYVSNAQHLEVMVEGLLGCQDPWKVLDSDRTRILLELKYEAVAPIMFCRLQELSSVKIKDTPSTCLYIQHHITFRKSLASSIPIDD